MKAINTDVKDCASDFDLGKKPQEIISGNETNIAEGLIKLLIESEKNPKNNKISIFEYTFKKYFPKSHGDSYIQDVGYLKKTNT